MKETEEVKNLGVEVLDDTNNTSNLVSSSVYDTYTSEALVCDSSRLGISGVGGYDTYRQYGYQGQGGVAPGQMYPDATRYTQQMYPTMFGHNAEQMYSNTNKYGEQMYHPASQMAGYREQMYPRIVRNTEEMYPTMTGYSGQIFTQPFGYIGYM